MKTILSEEIGLQTWLEVKGSSFHHLGARTEKSFHPCFSCTLRADWSSTNSGGSEEHGAEQPSGCYEKDKNIDPVCLDYECSQLLSKVLLLMVLHTEKCCMNETGSKLNCS